MSLRDEILGFDDLIKDIVVVPEWGDMKIELRSATAGERAELMSAFLDDEGNVDQAAMQAAAVVMCAYDPETAEKVFTEADIGPLLKKNARAVQRVFEAASPLMGLTEDSVEEGKDGSSGEAT